MSALPATVSNLDFAVVVEALTRRACNVTDTAHDLQVPPSDLRRLMWANPQLQDQAFEVVEARLDLAETNIAASLRSGDGRERLAASMFVIRNSHKARKRGWITSSSSAAELSVSAELDRPRKITFSWRRPDGEDDERLTDILERDGQRFAVPRYGEPIEGEVVTPPVLIEPARACGEAQLEGMVWPAAVLEGAVAVVDHEPEDTDNVQELEPLIGEARDRVEAALRQRPGDREVILATVEANGFDISGL
jgi:hypothetical protein